MALFQPINVIPSSFTDGVVDVNDYAQISWQVNGNSSMTAYQIDFYQNDAVSTPILSASTGKITKGISSGGFYGADRFGQPKVFTWSAGKSWNSYNVAFKNGNQYKFKITQWYSASTEVFSVKIPEEAIDEQTYYFTIDEKYYSFSIFSAELFRGAKICYSATQELGWAEINTLRENGNIEKTRVQLLTFFVSDEAPSSGTQIEEVGIETNSDAFIQEYADNAFLTRSKPELRIDKINGTTAYSSSSISSSILNAVAEYNQAEGDSIRSIRWRLVNADNGDVLDDTGEVNTAVSQYEYDGLFNGMRCSLSVYIETTVGVTASATVEINVSYTENTYEYGITAQCNENRNAVALSIETEGGIPATVDSENDYLYNGGTVILKPGKTIKWSKIQSSNGLSSMSFSSPYYVAIQFPRRLNPFTPQTSPATILANHRIVIEQGGSTITISESQYGFNVSIGIRSVDVSLGSMGYNQNITIFLTKDGVYAKYSGDQDNPQTYKALTYSQGAIRSISISNTSLPNFSALNVALFNYIAVYKGSASSSTLWEQLKSTNYEPSWSDQSRFPAYFIAQFNGTLNAGFSSLPLNYHLFRVDNATNKLKLIRKSNIGDGNLIDYGVTSGKTYQYYLFVLNSSNQFYASVQTKTISVRLGNFSLVATRFNEEDGCYHVKQEFIFQGNLVQGDVSNNNSPQFFENFTKYPTRMGSAQNSKSGTLQSLIGYVGSQSDYTESMDVEERLYNLSTDDYILFLRDTKGHIRMVQTSAPVSQQYNLKSRAMQTTISFSWREIGDASECSIVKTGDDY